MWLTLYIHALSSLTLKGNLKRKLTVKSFLSLQSREGRDLPVLPRVWLAHGVCTTMSFVCRNECVRTHTHTHTSTFMQHVHLYISIPEFFHSIHLPYANLGHEAQRPNANKRSVSRCFEFPACCLLLLKCKVLLLPSYLRGWREECVVLGGGRGVSG